MARELYILESDKRWARERIAALEKEIQELGPEFYDVFNQSSETWHDNAPFDALRDRQAVLFAELSNLKAILRDSLPSTPRLKKSTVGIGSVVTLQHGDATRQLLIAGDWTPRSGATENNITVVSSQSPMGVELIGKKLPSETTRGTIIAIDSKSEHSYNET